MYHREKFCKRLEAVMALLCNELGLLVLCAELLVLKEESTVPLVFIVETVHFNFSLLITQIEVVALFKSDVGKVSHFEADNTSKLVRLDETVSVLGNLLLILADLLRLADQCLLLCLEELVIGGLSSLLALLRCMPPLL